MWQKIETAPISKDYTDTFLAWDGKDYSVVYSYKNENIHFWDSVSQGIEIFPTHWMPLPSAPSDI